MGRRGEGRGGGEGQNVKGNSQNTRLDYIAKILSIKRKHPTVTKQKSTLKRIG